VSGQAYNNEEEKYMGKPDKVSILAVIGVMAILFISGAVGSVYADNIVIRVMAVNPSREHSQTVPVKAYLPKEAKPEHVVDMGDLEIAYDTQQGSYYVFGEYELKPQEIIEREIEIRNIWVIEDAEIKSLSQEIIKLHEMLRNTEFSDRIIFLKNSIDTKLNEISQKQADSPVSPQQGISEYRNNLKILESVKADLALAQSLLSQAKPFDWKVTWKVILGIIIFLGILGLSFYLIWHKQLKAITREDSSFYIPKEEVSPLDTKEHNNSGEEKTKGTETDKPEYLV
jgi:hypothetical protein